MSEELPTYPDLDGEGRRRDRRLEGDRRRRLRCCSATTARVAVCGRDEGDIERVTAETREAGAAEARGSLPT